MNEEIRQKLLTMADEDYRQFSASLIPGVETMLGVRIPQLRKMAKDIAKEDWKSAIEGGHTYFEEVMLHGLVLSYVRLPLEQMLPYIRDFIPFVDNWSVCDSVFMGMKVFRTDRERTWQFLQPYLSSDREFEIRIALMVMMQHFLKCDKDGNECRRLRSVSMEMLSADEKAGKYLHRIFSELNKVKTDAYYASMMAAWLAAEAFCCFPKHTLEYIKKNTLDLMTRNRAVRKILESRIPDKEVKDIIRNL